MGKARPGKNSGDDARKAGAAGKGGDPGTAGDPSKAGQPSRQVLLFECGASWLWLLAGPAAALAMVVVQFRAGVGFQLTVPMMFFVLVTTFMALQVKAARVHTSVELTRTTLREGTELLEIKEIVSVFPEPREPVRNRGPISSWRVKPSEAPEPWQRARALGELSGVPRGRTGVGLELTGGRLVQAWARDADALRAELTRLVG